MPEGPEVAIIRDRIFAPYLGWGLKFYFFGTYKTKNSDLSVKKLAKADQLLIRATTHGKYTQLELQNLKTGQESSLVIHLGMEGKWSLTTDLSDRTQHTHMMIRILHPQPLYLRYDDFRRFGFLDLFYEKISLAQEYKLGIDPLKYSTFEKFYQSLPEIKTRKNIYNFLLDQDHLCGIGNYLACEILFNLRLHYTEKFSPSKKFFKAVYTTMWHFYDMGMGERYSEGKDFSVYMQEEVEVDGKIYEVKQVKFSGRTIHYVPKLQVK